MHRTLISAAVLALAGLSAQPVIAAPAAAQPAMRATTQLPRSVRPAHYDVSLTPDAAHSTFAGKVTITLEVLNPTTSITLNATDLAFTKAMLVPAAGGAPMTATASVDAAAQTATFTFAQPLAKGRYRLALDYHGVIGQQAVGLFSLDYDTPAGKKRALYTQQMGLLSDSWSLGMAGLQPASDFLDLASAATPAAGPQVWGKIAGVFRTIHNHYAGDRQRQQRFDRIAIGRLAPVFQQVGWNAGDGENATIANLRAELIDTLSELDDQSTVAEARRRYAAQATDPLAVPGALRKTIMSVVAAHADGAAWDGLRRAALAEKSPMIKDQLYRLLASAGDDALARRALELAMTDEPGVTNSAAMLAQVAQDHPEMAFDFALANMVKVNERVDATSRSRYFPRLAAGSADQATIAKLDAYAGANLAAGSRRDADTAIAGIRDRIKVRAERLPAIDAWLAAHAK